MSTFRLSFQINRHPAAACNNLIIGRAEDGPPLDHLRLADSRAILRFSSGPLFERFRWSRDRYRIDRRAHV
jgi:hypothetical protein